MKKQLLLTCIVLLALMPMRADAKSDPLARFEVGDKTYTVMGQEIK